jgi:hypothetical protein
MVRGTAMTPRLSFDRALSRAIINLRWRAEGLNLLGVRVHGSWFR